MTHQTAIVTYTGTTEHRAARWADMRPDERRRRALAAATTYDAAELWQLAESHLYRHGSKGARVSVNTLTAYRYGVRVFTEWARTHGVPIARATTENGTDYARHLEGAGYSPATVRSRVAAAKRLCAGLRWAGAATVDPFADVRLAPDPTPPEDKRQPVSEPELAALLAQASPLEVAFLLVAGHGGARISEALSIEWGDVDGHRLHIRAGKGGRARAVEMTASLCAALAAIRPPDASGRVFRFRHAAARQRLSKLYRRAELAPKPYHSLRHAAGCLALRATGNLDAVRRHLGHSSLETTKVYLSYTADELARAFAAI